MAEDARTPVDGVAKAARDALRRRPGVVWAALTALAVVALGVTVWSTGWGDGHRGRLDPGAAPESSPGVETVASSDTSVPDTTVPDSTVPETTRPTTTGSAGTSVAGPTSTYDPRCAKGPSVVYDLVLPDLTGMTVAQVEALSDPEQPDAYCPQKWRHILQGDIVAVVCTTDANLFETVAAQGVPAGTVVPSGVTQLHLTLYRSC